MESTFPNTRLDRIRNTEDESLVEIQEWEDESVCETVTISVLEESVPRERDIHAPQPAKSGLQFVSNETDGDEKLINRFFGSLENPSSPIPQMASSEYAPSEDSSVNSVMALFPTIADLKFIIEEGSEKGVQKPQSKEVARREASAHFIGFYQPGKPSMANATARISNTRKSQALRSPFLGRLRQRLRTPSWNSNAPQKPTVWNQNESEWEAIDHNGRKKTSGETQKLQEALKNILGDQFFRTVKCLYPPISRSLDEPLVNIRERGKRRIVHPAISQSPNTVPLTFKRGQQQIQDLDGKVVGSYTSPTRRPNFSEQLLYNAQSYDYHAPGHLNPYKLQVDRFEFAWTPIRPLVYFVQDHKSQCPMITRWPTELNSSSSMRFRYDTMCMCSFERSISYFVAPFHFQAFHISAPSVISSLNPFGSVRFSKARSSSAECEVFLGRLSELRSHNIFSSNEPESSVKRKSVSQILRRGAEKVRKKTVDTTTKLPLISSNRPSRTVSTAGVSVGRKSSEFSRTRFSSFSRSPSQPANIFPISVDRQYVRSISNNLWIRSKSCTGTNRPRHLPIVLFFCGKDMLALGWLDLLSQWIEAEIKAKLNPATKEKPSHKIHTTMRKTATSSNTPIVANKVSDAAPNTSSKAPRHLPKWDERALSRQSQRSTRRIEERTNNADSNECSHCVSSTIPKLQETPPSRHFITRHSVTKVDTPLLARRTSTSSHVPNVECCINVAFGLVEYPGYGHGEGLPSPSSCVDSGLEVVRSIIGHMNPETVELHIISYSLGCAIGLRVANMIADQLIDNSRCRNPAVTKYRAQELNPTLIENHNVPFSSPEGTYDEKEPLAKIVALKSLLLVAPFSTTWETANSLLHVPPGLQRVSKFLFDIVSDKTIQYDNKDSIGRLARLVKTSWTTFPDFTLTIMFGDRDPLIPPTMGPSLASRAREVIGSQLLGTGRVKINCVRVVGADHATILDPRRLLKVLLKHHRVDKLVSL